MRNAEAGVEFGEAGLDLRQKDQALDGIRDGPGSTS
jgi:hypothetical protein